MERRDFLAAAIAAPAVSILPKPQSYAVEIGCRTYGTRELMPMDSREDAEQLVDWFNGGSDPDTLDLYASVVEGGAA